MEMLGRQFKLYKTIAKELRKAAADSEDIFGEDLTQQDIVNRAIAKYLKIDLEEVLNKEDKEKGSRLSSIDSEESSMEATERWNEGSDNDDEGEERIKEPKKLPPEHIDAILECFAGGRGWGNDIRLNADTLLGFNIEEHLDEIKIACVDRNIPFIP